MGAYGTGFGIFRDAYTGGGDITGTGTAPKIPKFTGGTVIGDSQMSDNGTTVFVGTTATSASALFEVNSTTQGFLAPRMTEAQKNAIGTPATGLLIYQTDGTAGYYYYDGASWQIFTSGATDTNIYNSSGSLTGTRTVTMGGLGLFFSGGKTTFTGSGTSFATSGVTIRNASLVDTVNFRDDNTVYFTNRIGIGVAPIIPTLLFSLASTTHLIASRVSQTYAVGSVVGLQVTIGGAATTNTGITVSSLNATNNYAIVTTSGRSVFGASTGDASVCRCTATSVSQGFLEPRMTEAQKNAISSPATGLQVYQTDGTAGMYYYNGSVWLRLTDSASDTNIYNSDGSLTGNRTVTQGANTLAFTSSAVNGFSVAGTTFSVDGANNRVGIGISTPTSKLQVRGSGNTVSTIATRIENASATLIAAFRDDTTILLNGHTAIGSGQATQAGVVLRVGETFTNGISAIGTQSAIVVTPSAATSNSSYAMQGTLIITNANFSGGIQTGGHFAVIPLGVCGSASLDAIGVDANLYKTVGSTSTFNNVYGVRSYLGVDLFGSGTQSATNVYNFYAKNGDSGLSSTNAYGLYIEALSRGTNNYGVISLTDRNGFGIAAPDNSSIVEMASTTKGFLMPRMTTTQRNAIVLPAKGLIIYNTTTDQWEGNSGTSGTPVWSILG